MRFFLFLSILFLSFSSFAGTSSDSKSENQRMVPHIVDGEIQGYKKMDIKPKKLKNLGLKKGDVLRSTDAKKVQSE